VDDAVDTVELLTKRFRAEGYDTAEAFDGEEALQKVPLYAPDLIVLDVMMPKIDGYDVCKQIKSDEKTRLIPVLMLTAKGEIEDKVHGLNIGADDYLAKPFDYKELSARVKSLLSIKAVHEKKVVEEKSGALEKMMDQVAHEIRNPLTAIGGFARKVFNRLSDDDPNKKYMEMIIEDVSVLEGMIKQLIELKSVAASYKETSDINDIIKDAMSIFEQELLQKTITVEKTFTDNLPRLNTDKKLLKRAFCSFIKNSIEAMQTGDKVLKVSTGISGNNIEVKISDTGKGISTDKIKHIFDPLFTSKTYGPGLGLTFAQKIIQDHRGEISVESEPGKGTTFTITFPV